MPRPLPLEPGLIYQQRLTIVSSRQGLHEITDQIEDVVRKSGVDIGLCQVFVQHTSCSLVIQENADPTARADLESWIGRLAPEGDARYTHTFEGADDMPAHLRAAVTHTSELIPIVESRLGLGTWQGLYLWEHRRRRSRRNLWVTAWGRSRTVPKDR